MSDFELIESTTQWRGAVFSAGIETFRYAGDPRVSREKVWHPGAVGILPVDDAHVWLTRQPREAVGLAASLEIPAGKRDVPGELPLETAKRELAEEIGKRAALVARDRRRSTRAPASATSASGGFWRATWQTITTPSPIPTSGSRSCRGRSSSSTRRSPSPRTRKSLIALLWLALARERGTL